jgi:TPR repeat protein
MLWEFGIFPPILVYCVKKNLATLNANSNEPLEPFQDSAYDYYQMGCERGYPRACLHAGVIDTFPPGVPITITGANPTTSGWSQSYDRELQRQRCKNLQRC